MKQDLKREVREDLRVIRGERKKYKVIDKKTNQECYLIFCFMETSFLA
jgi:predicted rRNA methylase YqxC with S4 and FtsJ domains